MPLSIFGKTIPYPPPFDVQPVCIFGPVVVRDVFVVFRPLTKKILFRFCLLQFCWMGNTIEEGGEVDVGGKTDNRTLQDNFSTKKQYYPKIWYPLMTPCQNFENIKDPISWIINLCSNMCHTHSKK